MAFSAAGVYSRVKSFANGGNLYPADLNSIQDDLGLRLQDYGFKTGDIKMTARGGDLGWLYCDGTPLTVAMGYTSLRNQLISDGSLYGSDGSGNPRVPDCRGRVPLAPDGGAGRISSSNSLGQTGGAETHVLTVAEMPLHSHAVKADPSNTNDSRGLAYAQPTVAIGGSSPNDSSYPIQGSGGGSSHTNVQHYICLIFMIKT